MHITFQASEFTSLQLNAKTCAMNLCQFLHINNHSPTLVLVLSRQTFPKTNNCNTLQNKENVCFFIDNKHAASSLCYNIIKLTYLLT